jgi:hypothetical protein
MVQETQAEAVGPKTDVERLKERSYDLTELVRALRPIGGEVIVKVDRTRWCWFDIIVAGTSYRVLRGQIDDDGVVSRLEPNASGSFHWTTAAITAVVGIDR